MAAPSSAVFVELDEPPIPAAARDVRPLDTALRLTAIAVLLRPMGPWFVQPALLALGAMVLISRDWLHRPSVWLAISLAITIRIADDWPLADNHIYLLAYWALAIGLSLRTADAPAALAATSRWLLGLAFVFAVLWKAAWSPDFLDQRFFRVTQLTDPRFTEVTMLIGGLSAEEIDADRAALVPLPHGAELVNPPAIVEPRRLKAFAAVSTWGVVALEAAVAALMLFAGTQVARLRHAALLTFCTVTYAFAPVAGFGWLLLVMGLAQVEPSSVWLRRLYVIAFLIVLFYSEVPWPALLVDAIR